MSKAPNRNISESVVPSGIEVLVFTIGNPIKVLLWSNLSKKPITNSMNNNPFVHVQGINKPKWKNVSFERIQENRIC